MKIIQGFGILIFYLNIYIITCIWQKSEYYDYYVRVCIPTIIFFLLSFFSGDRFWQLLLRTPTSLYLHSVPVLSSARSYFRGPIRNAHRYVEPGLHLGRTFDRVSFASRRRRRWPIVMYHWASWNASSEIVGPKQKGQKLYQLKR